MFDFTRAQQLIDEGKSVSRLAWTGCKHIRKATIADHEFLNTDSIEGLIMEDCDRKICDCKTGVWVQEAGDKEATDWYHFIV